MLSGTGEVPRDCSEDELESWADVLSKWTSNDQKPRQLSVLVKNGIPEALRGEVWQRLAGCENDSEMMDTFRILITKVSITITINFRIQSLSPQNLFNTLFIFY